jgi:hypothetical protein
MLNGPGMTRHGLRHGQERAGRSGKPLLSENFIQSTGYLYCLYIIGRLMGS